MKRVLVTGASGFIGHHLVHCLRVRELDVTCLVRKTSNIESLRELGCECVTGDIGDAESLSRVVERANPDSVFHLAGLTKAIRRQSLFDANQIGTRNLLASLSQQSLPPITVIVSSLAAAGPTNGSPRVESEEPTPVSNYGKSKLAAEQEARRFCSRVPITILRPPIVFGPYDRDGLELFKTITKLRVHPVPSLQGMAVSWIHVNDVCNAMIAAGEHGKRMNSDSDTDGIYFATSGSVDYAELGKRVGEATGHASTWTVPTARSMVWVLATVNEVIARFTGRPNIFNFDKAREATAGSWTCSGKQLQQDTGFTSLYSLTQTLKTAGNWYREAGWL